MYLNRKVWVDKTSFIVLVTSILLLIVYFPSVLLEVPFFKITHLEINVKNKQLKEIVERVIRKNFQSNWLLLKINEEKFNQLLRKYSQFYIENAQIASFSFANGYLKIKLNLNKPFLVINNKYFLAENGRIFKTNAYSLKNFPLLVDKNPKWILGKIYNINKLNQIKNLKELLKPKLIVVNKHTIIVKNDKANSVIPYEKLASVKAIMQLQKQYAVYKLYLNLFGKKSFSVKIVKE